MHKITRFALYNDGGEEDVKAESEAAAEVSEEKKEEVKEGE